MIVLDTDHLSQLAFSSERAAEHLVARIEAEQQELATTIINVEEELRGWLTRTQQQPVTRQVIAYENLLLLLEYLQGWQVLRFDSAAAAVFQKLRARRVRIGTFDLKIASICLVQDATLLTRNLVDFDRVPGLKIENWLDG